MIIILTTLAIILLLTYIFLILPTQWVKIERIKHPIGINKKILQISDIHIKNCRINPNWVLELIKKEKPDFIFITGDIIDKDNNEIKLVDKFLSIIKKSKVETFTVLGNHDRKLKDIEELEKTLTLHNVTLLKNEFVEKDTFYIIGIDDFTNGYHDIEKSFSFDNKDKRRLVMTHNAELILLDSMEKFDYLMAGHLHGKQINIPFLFDLKPMGKLPNLGIYKDMHITENGPIYISKGIGQSRYNVRFLVRSEVTIHYL